MRPYLIVSPVMSKRGGTKALHKLGDAIRAKGALAYYCYENLTPYGCKRLQEDAIVVYPEVVVGNPLRFRRVARWDLAKPVQKYGPEDVVFVYAPGFAMYSQAPDGNVLQLSFVEPDLFRAPEVENRNGDVVYFGKCHTDWPDNSAVRRASLITYAHPNSRPELAALLQRSRVLYTFDDCTALVQEAMLCGCAAVIVRPWFFTEAEIRQHLPGAVLLGEDVEKSIASIPEVRRVFAEQLAAETAQVDNFIAKTQAAEPQEPFHSPEHPSFDWVHAEKFPL